MTAGKAARGKKKQHLAEISDRCVTYRISAES